MRIGIDISQIVYEGTGVARYVRELVQSLVTSDATNHYILFGSSFRQQQKLRDYVIRLNAPNVAHKIIPLPPWLLDILWNVLHIIPVEWFTGPLDVFWSSDWTQPPLIHAKGITTIHDLSIFHFPDSFDRAIFQVQKRRLKRARHECQLFLCDSRATKNDVIKLLGIPEKKLYVVYPGR